MEYARIIDEKVATIKCVLEVSYGLTLQKQRELQYCVKYHAFYKAQPCGVLNCFYAPKKQRFTVVCEKGDTNLSELIPVIQEEIECKQEVLGGESKGVQGIGDKQLKMQELDYYYETLKAYENLNVSYEAFENKLREYVTQYGPAINVAEGASFQELECTYKELKVE